MKDVNNDPFAQNSWYFRNALVRANYSDIKNGIYETTEFLERFLRNVILGERNSLHNRSMHVSGAFSSEIEDDPINDPIKMDEREMAFLELLRSKPGLTRAQMAKILGCSDSTVKRIIHKLVSENVIRRIGSNKSGEWIIL